MRIPTLLAVAAISLAGCSGLQAPGGRQVDPPPPPRVPIWSPAAVDHLATGFVAARFADLDSNDRRRAAETIVSSLENGRPGQPNPWRNPDSRNSGETVPAAQRAVGANARCRPFTHTASVGGRSVQAAATACRDADGVWRVVSGA